MCCLHIGFDTLARDSSWLVARGGRCKQLRATLAHAGIFGPTNIGDAVGAWPHEMVLVLEAATTRGLFEPRCLEFSQHAWRSGIPVSSHYSGSAGDVIGLGFFNDAGRDADILRSHDRGFYLVDVVDNDKVCQKVLCGFDEKASFRPMHAYGDMLDRVGEKVKGVLETIAPSKHDDPEVGAQAFDCMREVLAMASSKVFCDGAAAPCVLHNCMCKLYDAEADFEVPHDYSVWWAGTTCLDVTRAGSRAGFYGPHSKVVFLVFLFS